MNLGIAGKRALVTAGSRGIGAAIVKALQAEGVRVFNASRSTAWDLMAPDATQALVECLWRENFHPDIIVHSLGGTLGVLDAFASAEDWLKVYRINLGVAVELNRLLVPHMQRQKWGRVVHNSSVSSLENQGPVAYCSMKAAVNAYVRGFGRSVASSGVNVSAILPGAILTDGGYWDTCDRAHAAKFLSDRMAIGRFGTPEEIGKIVAFMCSEHASFIVGSSWLVDGGQGRAVG
jgi:3-oxoacyl-[acyl-carrier protein] reductase